MSAALRTRVSRVLAVSAALGAAGLSLAGASAAHASTPIDGVVISEVQTHGAGVKNDTVTDGDWIELHNTTGSTVTLTGAILADSDDTHKYVIGTDGQKNPSAVTLAAGAYKAFRTDAKDSSNKGNVGLGDVDSARLYASTQTVGVDTPVDEFDWSHSPVYTWARNSAGTFVASAGATPDAANNTTPGSDSISGVKINEVNMNGGPDGDWVELYNTTGSSINLANAILSDDDATHAYIIGSSAGDTTMLGSHQFAVYQVDDSSHLGNFGLSDADSVELYDDSNVDLFASPVATDSVSWAHPPIFTLARSMTGVNGGDGTGAFIESTGPSMGETNADASSLPSGSALTGIRLNEVKTTGDAVMGDWVELLNTNGSGSVDLSNAIIADDNNGNFVRINSGISLGAGDEIAITTDTNTSTFPPTQINGGTLALGDADAVRLYPAGSLDLSGTPVDSVSWSDHSITSLGRTPGLNAANTQADWATTHNATPGDDNDFTFATDYVTDPDSFVQLNEVESTNATGDPISGNDWVELINTAPVSIDVDGAILSDDNPDGNQKDKIVLDSSNTQVNACVAHVLGTPTAGTDIPAGGFALVKVDDDDIDGSFGLGSDDSIRFFEPGADVDTDIALDHEAWSDQPTGSYQRQDNGLGTWVDGGPSTQSPLAPNAGC
jgi:Lamin Tail Domain